jgi:hypothetical protein
MQTCFRSSLNSEDVNRLCHTERSRSVNFLFLQKARAIVPFLFGDQQAFKPKYNLTF